MACWRGASHFLQRGPLWYARAVAAPSRHTRIRLQEFGEKGFYLDEFRTRTLCFAVFLADCERPGGFETLGTVLRELIANGTRVIVLVGVPRPRTDGAASLQSVRHQLRPYLLLDDTVGCFPTTRGQPSAADSFVDFTGDPGGDCDFGSKLELVWQTLRAGPLLVGLVDDTALVEFAQHLAGRLRVLKLLIAESQGGISSASGACVSFMDDAMLAAVLGAGEAEWAGLGGRVATLKAIRAALRGGVHAVNLCSLEELARELYTYEGAGTLFTLEDYCRVERLGIDDFEEVERLIERGHREGYLRPRSEVEKARILLNGFGARIGARHLAGVCGLETEAYRRERAGEIVGLYTITRFKGEGVGGRLIEQVLAQARDLGLIYVFACTVEQRAQVFFERQGFRLVTREGVPAVKWTGYDPDRLGQLKVYRYDLA